MTAFQPPRPRLSKILVPKYLLILFTISTTITIAGLSWFLRYYETHIPFNTTINGIAVENKTSEEALQLVKTQLPELEERTITLSFDEVSLASSSADLGYTYDLDTAVKTAFAQYEDRSVIGKVRHLAERLKLPQDIQVKTTVDTAKATTFVTTFAESVNIVGQEPMATLSISNSPGSLKINPGEHGQQVDIKKTVETIQSNVGNKNYETLATVVETNKILSEAEVELARSRATKVIGFSQTLEYDTTRVFVTDKDLISLLTLPEGINETKLEELIKTWAERIERKPQNATFTYDKETLAVSDFQPPREGLALEEDVVKKHVITIITDIDLIQDVKEVDKNPETVQLPVKITQPAVTLAKTNTLGIQERVGVGESWYRGSIPSRIHNVGLAASRIANYIVKPGEEFSFNNAVGDVSAQTGFQSAYVIMNGQTVLGDGGGVCQVSTTLFRALLNSGISITRRLPHSYRVGYYEQNGVPGIDATVYSGEVDLRFKNDTPGHILIHTRADSKNQYMIVELYGTSDGRTAQVTEIKQWDAVPALPPQYIPDPSLAPGQTKQIDWAVGGLKTSFRHIVKDKNGKIITDKVYTSNYRPWAAKYLQGV